MNYKTKQYNKKKLTIIRKIDQIIQQMIGEEEKNATATK